MPVHYIWCSCQDPGEKGKGIARKKDVCLPGATCWCREELHSVLPFNASEGYLGQQTHGLPSWLEIMHTHYHYRSGQQAHSSPGWWGLPCWQGFTKALGCCWTLLGDKCQGVLDDWGPSCWQGHTRCQACTQVLHLKVWHHGQGSAPGQLVAGSNLTKVFEWKGPGCKERRQFSGSWSPPPPGNSLALRDTELLCEGIRVSSFWLYPRCCFDQTV